MSHFLTPTSSPVSHANSPGDDNGLKPLTLISKNTLIAFTLIDYTFESLKQYQKLHPGDEPSRCVLVLLASKTAG